jgi:spore coat protein H
MTDKELLTTLKRTNQKEDLAPIITRYLPLVTTTIAAQINDTEDIQSISEVVFQTLGYRSRRLSKKTFLPGWMIRTATYAVNQWILSQPTENRDTTPKRLALQALTDLPLKYSDALVANAIHKADLTATAHSLQRSLGKTKKWVARGERRLGKKARKRGLLQTGPESPLDLAFLREEPPNLGDWNIEEMASRSLVRRDLSNIVKQTLKSWSWLYWKRRFKAMATAIGCLVALIASIGIFFFWAWETGYLMSWMITLSPLQALDEAPELGLPPREWSAPGIPFESIQSRGDLFGATHIWRVNFTFTTNQWAGITPIKIKPTKLFSDDGNMVLRNPNAKRSGLSGVVGIEFDWTQANIQFGGQAFTNIATRYRGNGTYVNSLYGSKQPFKIDLNKHHPDQKIQGLDKLNFNNLVEDASFMHDTLGYALFRAAGVASPRTAYAWMTITIGSPENRKPNGFYLILENIDQRFAKDRFGTSKTPIFKPVTPYLFSYLGEDWSAYDRIYDLKTEATDAQKQQVIDFANSLTNDDDDVFAARINQFVDLDQFSRFLASIVLIASYDGFLTNGQNFYLYLNPETNLIGFIPWDLDHAWGDFPFIGSASDRDQASIWHPWAGTHRFLERIMAVDEFRDLYREQLEALLANEFNPEVLSPRIDAIAEVIQDPVEHDNPFRFRRFKEAVGNDWGDPPPHVETMIRPVNAIKRFIDARSKSVRAQLDGESEGIIPEMMAFGPGSQEE